MRKRLSGVLALLMLIVFLSWSLVEGCKGKGTNPSASGAGDTAIKGNVRADLEMAPPISDDITIRQLDKPTDQGNVLITTRIPGITDRSHTIIANDEKLVLHDDGANGDEKAGDGVFSLVIKEDLAEFGQEVQLLQQQSKRFQGNKPLFNFQNREAIPLNENQTKILSFSAAELSRGVHIPKGGFTLAPDPALKDHSLMITDVGVVTDPTRTFNPCTNVGNPNGVWTFGQLITNMAGSVPPQDFVKNWLDNWLNTSLVINSDNVPARTGIFNSVIVPWIKRTTPSANPTQANWKTFPLDLKFAPFKLLAIVNRLDLRGNSGYGFSNAGEGRFVFGVLTSSSCTPLAGPGKFTVIFEYGIPKKTCAEIKDFATQWFNLKGLALGTTTYNSALQAITDQFTAANTSPSKPNGSSLNQVRTNEFALGGPFWELREFRIDKGTHQLSESTVTKEPAEKYNRMAGATAANMAILANYINTNEPSVIANTNTVPLTFSGQPFLGGRAQTRTPSHFWDGTTAAGPGFINNNDARHVFSLNTCSGCHGGEGHTATGNLINDPSGVSHNAFLQIAPQNGKATLSAFLTGDPSQPDGMFQITDPAGRPAGAPTVRKFNDLQRRAQDLQALANTKCTRIFGLINALTFKPLNMTH